MISKRTAIILIVAIIAIVIFEANFSFDKMGQIEENLEHTVAQITLNIDGKPSDLKAAAVTYEYTGSENALTASLSELNDTGFESLGNNSVGFKPCGKGSNKLTFTIPENLIPTYGNDLTVSFGCENNEADFNNYSVVINLTTVDEENIKADVVQTLYYPDENGNALNRKAEVSSVVNIESSTIECFIK